MTQRTKVDIERLNRRHDPVSFDIRVLEATDRVIEGFLHKQDTFSPQNLLKMTREAVNRLK